MIPELTVPRTDGGSIPPEMKAADRIPPSNREYLPAFTTFSKTAGQLLGYMQTPKYSPPRSGQLFAAFSWRSTGLYKQNFSTASHRSMWEGTWHEGNEPPIITTERNEEVVIHPLSLQRVGDVSDNLIHDRYLTSKSYIVRACFKTLSILYIPWPYTADDICTANRGNVGQLCEHPSLFACCIGFHHQT